MVPIPLRIYFSLPAPGIFYPECSLFVSEVCLPCLWAVPESRACEGLQAPEHPAVAVLKFALIFEPGVPQFHYFTGSADSAAGPSERSRFLFSLLTLRGGGAVLGFTLMGK